MRDVARLRNSGGDGDFAWYDLLGLAGCLGVCLWIGIRIRSWREGQTVCGMVDGYMRL